MLEMAGRVELRDVSFHYPSRPEMPILDKLNLTIEAGQTTGIFGLSGSGKSTVTSLAQRFYDADEGAVLVDGYDVRDVNLHSLRGHIGYVEQTPVLFDRSVLENIAHGLVSSSRPKHQALRPLLVNGHLPELAAAVHSGGNLDQLAASTPGLTRILALSRQAAI